MSQPKSLWQLFVQTVNGIVDREMGIEACDACGRPTYGSQLKKRSCRSCERELSVCFDDMSYPTCLECGYSLGCEVCCHKFKESVLNKVVCSSCEAQIRVCDDHLAGPVCSKCVKNQKEG